MYCPGHAEVEGKDRTDRLVGKAPITGWSASRTLSVGQFGPFQSLGRLGGRGDIKDDSAVFSAGGPWEKVRHEEGCPLFGVVPPAFPPPTTASLTLHGVLKDSFAAAVVVCDMPEPCKFPSLDSCQKSFLWTHKKVDLAPHPAIGLVLQVGDTAEFPHALGFQSLDNFFRVSKQGPCFKAVEEDGGDKKLIQLELACKADGVAPPDPV